MIGPLRPIRIGIGDGQPFRKNVNLGVSPTCRYLLLNATNNLDDILWAIACRCNVRVPKALRRMHLKAALICIGCHVENTLGGNETVQLCPQRPHVSRVLGYPHVNRDAVR